MRIDRGALPVAFEARSGKSTPRKRAMDLLARREHSAAEIRAKLIARDFDADEVDAAVTKLAGEGLISDDRFAEAFVSARVRKRQGPLKIRVELERRGVAPDLIANHLEHGTIDWDALALGARDKKFGAGGIRDYREWARQARFLQQRGFDNEQIRRALGRDYE